MRFNIGGRPTTSAAPPGKTWTVLRDCYQGRWDSVSDYAEDFLDALGLPQIIEQAVPEELQPYVTIDADAFGRDMAANGEMYVVEDDPAGGVFIFGP